MKNEKFINKINNLERKNKIFIILFFDLSIAIFAFLAAYVLIEKQLPNLQTDLLLIAIHTLVSIFTVYIFYSLKLYKDIFRYIGINSLVKLSFGVFLSALMLYFCVFMLLGYGLERLSFLYMLIFGMTTTAMRIFARLLLKDAAMASKNAINVIIYGAGESGYQMMQMMRNSNEYKLVGFLDDDAKKQGLKLEGVTIYPSIDAPHLCQSLKVKTIILAMPSARRSVRRKIIFSLEDCDATVKSLPHLKDLVNGVQSISDIQDIDITELLGREPVSPNQELFTKCITNKVVLVTGGAGSIGSEICRQIITNKPKTLIILDISEFSLYAIEQELKTLIKTKNLVINLVPIMGSVQSKQLLKNVFAKFNIDTVYHAAAYKHVPLVEQNIVEGVTNNIFGTLNVAKEAIKNNVAHFTLVSTDKAVRPTNVMGASKRMAELVLQALATENHKTCFSMVRFGNVLGSSGSVVPLFKKQIEVGGPVTVTHPEIIRFFMTIPEASQLVIQAGAMAKGGEVYVLDMGEPIKIYDLARQMINLAGLSILDVSNPEGDIEIQFSGLRPGEKLYEELLIGDNVIKTDHTRILAANEICLSWQNYETMLDRLKTACDLYDIESLHNIFIEAPVGYKHNGKYVDELKSFELW